MKSNLPTENCDCPVTIGHARNIHFICKVSRNVTSGYLFKKNCIAKALMSDYSPNAYFKMIWDLYIYIVYNRTERKKMDGKGARGSSLAFLIEHLFLSRCLCVVKRGITWRSCFAASAPALVWKVTKPTGWNQKRKHVSFWIFFFLSFISFEKRNISSKD